MFEIEVRKESFVASNTGEVTGIEMILSVNGEQRTSYFVDRWEQLFDQYEREFADSSLWEPEEGRPFCFLTKMLELAFAPGCFNEAVLPLKVSCAG